MVIEMELHGMATGTQSAYLRAVRNFIVFTGKRVMSCFSLTLDDVKTFMHHHLKVLLQASQTINVKCTVIKFLYIHIDIHWDDNKVSNVKNHKTVPVVLIMEEAAKLINAIENPTYKTIVILMYSVGLRVSEE